MEKCSDCCIGHYIPIGNHFYGISSCEYYESYRNKESYDLHDINRNYAASKFNFCPECGYEIDWSKLDEKV